jgi:hypothetical protein
MTTPKDVWIHNVIESLKQIASAEFQEKGWVRGEIHDYCCYIETIAGLSQEGLFNDFVDEKAKEFGFSDEQIKKLDQFRKAIRAFDLKFGGWEDPKTIISDPDWLKIRELAKDALKSLGIEKYLDPSKSIFKDSLLNRIYYLTDPDAQERWCMQERASEQLFDELMNSMFKKCKFSEVVTHYKEYEITDAQALTLRQFYEALKAYREKQKDTRDIREVFNDPEWHQIQALAGEVVKIFDYKP